MRLSAIIHFVDEDPVLGELEGLPDPAAQFVTLYNPRRRDGRTATFLDANVETVLFAWHRITHVQLLPQANLEQVIGFVRE
jgi:hypothetical protein